MDVLHQLHLDLSADLARIAKRFKSPKLTLVVRNPRLADGDVVLTDDDPEKAIASIRRFIECETEQRTAAQGGEEKEPK
jgi:hypothetical protein